MARQGTEIVVGAFVLAAAIGFFAYAMSAIKTGPVGDLARYYASFSSVEGVSIGTDVRLAGVKVGSVAGLELNAATFRADAVIAIDKTLKLPDDTAILISSEGLLGGSFVELLPGGSPFELEPEAEIEDTQSAVSLINLLLRFVSSSNEGSP